MEGRELVPVVGAAIVRSGRVLATRRTAPPETAGRWEFPGGKVDPGESPEEALVREVGEELGCEITVVDWLPGNSRIGERYLLTVALARLAGGDPEPTEHDAVAWLGADELDTVDWLEGDRPFLPPLAAELRAAAAALLRAIVFEEEHAEELAARLRVDGYDAAVVRERLQGEDDDEDHPWAVLTDAPEPMVDLLLDAYDGWLDAEEVPPAPAPPLELPTEPKRIKRLLD